MNFQDFTSFGMYSLAFLIRHSRSLSLVLWFVNFSQFNVQFVCFVGNVWVISVLDEILLISDTGIGLKLRWNRKWYKYINTEPWFGFRQYECIWGEIWKNIHIYGDKKDDISLIKVPLEFFVKLISFLNTFSEKNPTIMFIENIARSFSIILRILSIIERSY